MNNNRILTLKDLERFYGITKRSATNYMKDMRETFEFPARRKLTILHLASYEKLPLKEIESVLSD